MGCRLNSGHQIFLFIAMAKSANCFCFNWFCMCWVFFAACGSFLAVGLGLSLWWLPFCCEAQEWARLVAPRYVTSSWTVGRTHVPLNGCGDSQTDWPPGSPKVQILTRFFYFLEPIASVSPPTPSNAKPQPPTTFYWDAQGHCHAIKIWEQSLLFFSSDTLKARSDRIKKKARLPILGPPSGTNGKNCLPTQET